MNVFSPLIQSKDVPESLWLPPEVRSTFDNENSRGFCARKASLRAELAALNERIEHVDSLVRELDIENRLKRLDFRQIQPAQDTSMQLDPCASGESDYISSIFTLKKPQRGA